MRLDLVVGPNGAGKSTFVRLVLEPVRPGVPFVNADLIARRRWPEEAERHAYEAARIAAATRRELLGRREAFIAETVFSHPSKLELVQEAGAAGYYIALHVIMIPADLAVARVAARVAQGGHGVPESKIRERHERLWTHVAAAISVADAATCYDNTRISGPREIALFSRGFPIGAPAWTPWTAEVLRERWPGSG